MRDKEESGRVKKKMIAPAETLESVVGKKNNPPKTKSSAKKLLHLVKPRATAGRKTRQGWREEKRKGAVTEIRRKGLKPSGKIRSGVHIC